jgi:predicted metal-dependent hydrolase
MIHDASAPMTALRVRHPDFRIDETIPFQWQPANPVFGVLANAFTFVAIAFERYIVTAIRQAMEGITDPVVAAEADAFLRQEAQHARAHRHHARALVAQYPGLAGTLADADASYEELLEREPLEFHLAYVANLEATFTPLFKMILDHRGPLFDGGDERAGTLFLWHFVEEIEHRSAALVVHRHVTPSRWYRVRVAPRVLRHVTALYHRVLDGFEAHVPLADSHVPVAAARSRGLWTSELLARTPLLHRRRKSASPTMLQHVPGRDLLTMIWHLAKSQSPNHDPADEALPRWVRTWHEAFDAGEDITTYTGAHL